VVFIRRAEQDISFFYTAYDLYVCQFPVLCGADQWLWYKKYLQWCKFVDKSYRENQNTRLMLIASPPPPLENHTIHEMVWKNIVQPEMLLSNLNLRRNDAHCMPDN